MVGFFGALSTTNLVIVIIALITGFYMAWTIGANDVANSMGTSVGSGALSLKQAILVAGIFEFGGAILVGSHVSATIKSGIIQPELLNTPEIYSIAMLACLIAAAGWVFVATYFSLPISTTHSIVGSVIGIGLLLSPRLVNFNIVGNIALSWLLSPLAGAAIAFIFFKIITRLIFSKRDSLSSLLKIGPYLVFFNIFVISMSIFYKGLVKLGLAFSLFQSIEISFLVAVSAGLVSAYIFNTLSLKQPKSDSEKYRQIEKIFGYLQIMTACSVAFAHGANDVANAIGPLAAVINTLNSGAIDPSSTVPLYILIIGGIGIVAGIGTWGYRVIDTVGKKITEITPSRGFCAEIGTTITVLICSKMGLPISTTQVLVGAVMGVGFARGIAAIDFSIIRKIITSWVMTLPVAAFSSILIYQLLKIIFL
ncbi:MAG: inorganic phosphate transporter [Candidatus Methanofastidiosa archaeon]|nr:inorganic phosphate transporter [Candidatus Methanofastidiosa archaeon]